MNERAVCRRTFRSRNWTPDVVRALRMPAHTWVQRPGGVSDQGVNTEVCTVLWQAVRLCVSCMLSLVSKTPSQLTFIRFGEMQLFTRCDTQQRRPNNANPTLENAPDY